MLFYDPISQITIISAKIYLLYLFFPSIELPRKNQPYILPDMDTDDFIPSLYSNFRYKQDILSFIIYGELYSHMNSKYQKPSIIRPPPHI